MNCSPSLFRLSFISIPWCLFGLFFFVFSSCTIPAPVDYHRQSFSDVFKLAKKQNKKVFILITDSNCPSCKEFESKLEKNLATKKILDAQYICYKVDIRDDLEREMAQIVKCPSYPFPYFFKPNGELIAFGFPNSKNFDISNLSNINISEERFRELFRLSISTSDYKRLISMNMKAALLREKGQIDEIALADELMLTSLHIAPYPFNLKMINKLPPSGSEYKLIFDKVRKYNETSSDIIIYGKLKEYLNLRSDEENLLVSQDITNNDYKFDSRTKDLGIMAKKVATHFQFKIINISNRAIEIKNVTHPCDCIRIKVPVKVLGKDEVLEINGTFTPYEAGPFEKEIFVHTSSTSKPMDIFKITGITN